MTSSVPFASLTPRSKIKTEKASGVKPGPLGLALPGNVQVIVGLVPLAELVIVTLDGNGIGVAGIGAADGNKNVAVAPDGLLTSYSQVPIRWSGFVNLVARWQTSGSAEVGLHEAKASISGGAVEPAPGMKIPAPE